MASGLISITQTLGGSAITISHFALSSQVASGIVQLKTGWLDLGSPRLKYVDGIIFEITEDATFDALYYTVEHIERYNDRENPVTTGQIQLVDGDQFIPLNIVGRFFRVSLDDFAPNTQWKWSALEFYGNELEDPGL